MSSLMTPEYTVYIYNATITTIIITLGSISSFVCSIFLIGKVGGGIQLGPLGIATTNRLILPAPGDYDDGEIGGMIGRGNRVTRKNLPQCRFVHQTPNVLP
jgi:hypothetical protein